MFKFYPTMSFKKLLTATESHISSLQDLLKQYVHTRVYTLRTFIAKDF